MNIETIEGFIIGNKGQSYSLELNSNSKLGIFFCFDRIIAKTESNAPKLKKLNL